MQSVLSGLNIIGDSNYLNLIIEKEGKISELNIQATEFD